MILETLFLLKNLSTYLRQTTKSMVTTKGKHTPFVFRYVELIFGNSLLSIVVQNILTLFLLRSVALHLLYPVGKNLKHLLPTITSVRRTNMACQYVISIIMYSFSHLVVEFVVEGFSPGSPVFLPPQNEHPQIPIPPG